LADGRVRELTETVALAEENLEQIERSSSWRMTAPLRGLARWFRRRAKR
jgi:hypothetical protein